MEMDKLSFEKIVEDLHDGLYFVDKNRVITYWNKAAEHISGFSAEEVVGKSCSENVLTHVDAEGNQLCSRLCPMAATIADGKSRESTIYLHHKEGHRIPVSVRVSPYYDEKGNIRGGIELFTDVSNQAANELRVKELEKLALLDNLTQLPNRHYMEKEFHARFEEMKRFGVPYGILFLDIDHFKLFNDTYGHETGDKVLRFVAKTLVSGARPFDIYGRWGGEEFIGIIRNISAPDLENLGNRVRTLVGHSYVMHKKERLSVTISLGATLARVGESMKSLVDRADKFLYRSKEAGRNRLTLG